MIVLQLDDLTEDALQGIAKSLGISITSNMRKAQVVAAIADKLEAQKCLFLIPPTVVSIPPKPTTKDGNGWKSPASIIATISLIVAILACAASWWGTKAAVDKLNKEIDDENKKSWKGVKVYDIIVRNTNSHEKWTGLTLDEIRNSYNSEAASSNGVKIEKKDLEEDVLKEILFEMEARGVVKRTIDDKFMVVRSVAYSRDCAIRPNTETIEREVFAILKTESGKYTVEKLADKIKREKNINSEDVYAVLNCMISKGEIVINPDSTVIPASENMLPKVMTKPQDSKIEPKLPEPKANQGVPPQAPPIMKQ